MKKKVLFIINPISGVGRHRTVEKLISEELDRNSFDYELAYTKAPKHAIELSQQGVNEHFNIIVAVGGDGSVNEVGRSLISLNSEPRILPSLAILPCGSGNGTARHLMIPLHLRKAMKVLQTGKEMIMDSFSVNNEYVLNTAGIGFAAHIAHEFSKFKKRGFSNYIKIAIKDSLKYRSQQCQVTIGNQTETLNAFLIDIANGTQWGNNAVIAPNAKNDDGLLDLCMVRNFPYVLFPIMASRLFTRTVDHSKFVTISKIQSVKIKQEYSFAHIDGEPYHLGQELDIHIHPASLKVIVPK